MRALMCMTAPSLADPTNPRFLEVALVLFRKLYVLRYTQLALITLLA